MARILVTDDEKDVVDLIKFMLERDGHQVIEAYDGKEGLEKATSEHPDLMILDIMMPEMDGYTVTAKLAEVKETAKIPIIILTSKGQMRDLFEMSPNVVHYLDKPFDPATLRAKVSEILAKSRTASP